ncbi:hypothetical protein SAMN05428988_2318 [Chitinophaga sp. YR573]|uniref:hypothetical protein n=1 Tax=Chitinophaga sp. YR573 TaxID=1881040 RepID=UPI0008AC52F3|nr:hypothetical protein [Chitinophaga sp. YR573]SEW12863.1 hypothetical protein SAMN05428988_2318 [Chitinophaga sp. YR573]
MKKIILFSAVACSLAFYACKKDSKTDTPATDDTSTSIDPVALSAAVKIGYATSVTGNLPTASADGPTLLIDGYDNRTYYAVNNRYVVIYPQSDKGFVAGYYVKINGAQNYFKIDYKAAAGARKLNKSHDSREEGDNSDSSIVIKLPAGLKGNTFSIKYAAFDTLNHVSNTITAIVSVIASKDTADNSLLYGTWRYNRSKMNYNDWSNPQSYKPDTTYVNYSCIDGKLQGCTEGYSCEPYISRIYGPVSNDQIFSANNLYTTSYARIYKDLYPDQSTCSNLIYYDGSRAYSSIGGYTYNNTTKVLTLIYDENGTGDYVNNIYTESYTVTEISSTKLVYYSKEESVNNGDRAGARDGDIKIIYSEYLKQ